MPESDYNVDVTKLFPEEHTRRTFAKVFDRNTIDLLHSLAGRGHFTQVEFPISTGKEAHVFRAVDSAGNFRAIKIYKIDTSDFRHMDEYLRFDRRFEHIKPERRSIVHAWTQKEFTSLLKLQKHAVNVPSPQVAKENVLVMEFIGSKEGESAPKLKDAHIGNIALFYEALVQNIAHMLEAKLIHGDLSDYNILVKDDMPVIIDCGQVIPTTHPNAKKFYERDLNNMLKVLHRHGLKELEYEQFYSDIKKAKEGKK